MKRIDVMRLLPLLAVLALTSAGAQQREPRQRVEVFQVIPGFYRLEVHEYVNMMVYKGKANTVLVDTGFEPGELVTAAVDSLAGDRPVTLIINTHLNGDHIGNNVRWSESATVAAHSICLEQMKARKNFPAAGLPSVTFSDTLTWHLPDETIRLFHAPGHTGGDIVVWFVKSGVACVGDLIFSDSFPGVQIDNGGNVLQLEATLKKLTDLLPADIRIVTGHIRTLNLDELKAYHRMVSETIEIIRPLAASGQALENILASRPLKDFEQWNSRYFPGEITEQTWITQIVASLTAEQEK